MPNESYHMYLKTLLKLTEPYSKNTLLYTQICIWAQSNAIVIIGKKYESSKQRWEPDSSYLISEEMSSDS